VNDSHNRAQRKRGPDDPDTGPSPIDHRKTDSRHHLNRDGRRTPLNVITTTAATDGGRACLDSRGDSLLTSHAP